MLERISDPLAQVVDQWLVTLGPALDVEEVSCCRDPAVRVQDYEGPERATELPDP
jgi:hypothetical protein